MTRATNRPASPPSDGPTYLRLINRINDIIVEGGALERLLDRICDVVHEVLSLERVSILLLDPVTQRLQIRAARGIPFEEWPNISIPLGEGIAGRVARDGEPLMASDIAATNLPSSRHEGYQDNSFISVPLQAHDRTLGVLNVNNRLDGTPLGENDLQLTLALAAMVAMAVENSTLLSSAVTLQQHFRDVLRQLPHGVIVTDRLATVTLCNPVASRLIGVTSEEAVGRALHTLLPESLRGEIGGMVNECEGGRTAHATREASLTPRGSAQRIPARASLTILRDTQGEVEAVVLVLQDLSLSKEVEELRRLDELQSNFLAMVSHELRTPLTSIKGSVHLLSSGALEEHTEQRRGIYTLLRKNTERLIVQINNILDVNQLEHRTLTIFTKEFDIAHVLRRTTEAVRPDFEAKGITLAINVPDSLPFDGDQERLTQVFNHLLDNAMKFTPAGGEVNVEMAADPEWIRIHIRDTGIGVPSEFSDKVFAKFYQLEHTLTRKAGGNGLGLYISRGLVGLHGGDLRFVPVGPPGAEIQITLPRRSQPGPESSDGGNP